MKIFRVSVIIIAMALGACQQQANYETTEGQTINFSELKGKWVFINYWASWCTSCYKEIPEFNAFYEAHKNQNIVVLGVNYDQLPRAQLKETLYQLHILYPNLLRDPKAELHIDDLPALPATFVITPEGELLEPMYGEMTQESLEAVLHS